MFSQLVKLVKVLNSEVAPGQIALAIALALYTGFGPLLSPHVFVVFFMVCVIRVNLSAFFLATAGFAILAFALDPVFLSIGEALLGSEGLRAFWTGLYQLEWLRIFRFNHTLVMGSFVSATALLLPVFLFSRFVIIKYRENIMSYVNNLRLVKLLKASDWFQRYSELES